MNIKHSILVYPYWHIKLLNFKKNIFHCLALKGAHQQSGTPTYHFNQNNLSDVINKSYIHVQILFILVVYVVKYGICRTSDKGQKKEEKKKDGKEIKKNIKKIKLFVFVFFFMGDNFSYSPTIKSE